MSEKGPSFGEVEKNLIKEHAFERVQPKEKCESPVEDDKISGIMQMTLRKVISFTWRNMWTSIEEKGGLLPVMQQANPTIKETIASLSPAEACRTLSKTMTKHLAHELGGSMGKLERLQWEDFSEIGTYMNYKSTLVLGGSGIGVHKPDSHIFTGMKTGVVESWRMIMETCRAFEHQLEQCIDEDSLEEISRNSDVLLTKLASTHIRIFSSYSNVVNNQNGFELDMHPDPSLFVIEGEAPKRHLGLSPKLIKHVDGQYFGTDEKRFSGCPALFAQGVKRANVIEDLYHEMVIPAALHYLRPLLKNRSIDRQKV